MRTDSRKQNAFVAVVGWRRHYNKFESFTHVDTVPADRQTDRQTDGHRTIANEALAQRRGWYYYYVSALACHNFDLHQPILIISGRNVAKTVEVK